MIVYKEKNAITGNIVCAKVKLKEHEDKKQFISRLKKHCNTKLQSYQVPVKVIIDDDLQYGHRFKKTRSI